MNPFRSYSYFPDQKVSGREKQNADWYANCIDYIIDKAIACNDQKGIDEKINMLHGEVPDEFYKKTLNPYNSAKEKHTRFPATMRNLDIMSDIIRRYVGEYTKSPHEFIVGSNDPQIVINKQQKLREAVMQVVQQELIKEIQRRIQEKQQELAQQEAEMQQQQMQEQGGQMMPQGSSTGGQQQSQQQISPQDVMTPQEMEQFVKDWNENYIDEQTENGEKLLDYIRCKTKDDEIYAELYFNFVAFGRCFSYLSITDDDIRIECIPVSEAYPIPTRDKYVEDHDMFARRMMLSKYQIQIMFEEYMDKKDKEFFDKYYSWDSGTSSTKLLSYNQYFESYPDVCEKFTDTERKMFRENPQQMSDVNGDLFEVWHVVWKSFIKQGILTYVNESGIIDTMEVDEGFKLDKDAGHINIEWIYTPQIYEGYRIGGRYNAIYPIKARPVYYMYNYKLPYNGILEPYNLMGEFSIVSIITPYQVMRNIISFHREMVIAKNKLMMLILPESLITDKYDDRIYRMAADGTLIYDDTEDSNSLKAQQIRMLNANMGDYIRQLTDLIESLKNEAREMVDMTAQRYGEIATSAGKGTTEEAIARGSMGSVSINFAFDKFRCNNYQDAIDVAKLAFVDGVNDGYFDGEGNHQILELSSEQIAYSDLSVYVKNSQQELEKFEKLQQLAFSAAQNGEFDSAIAAVTGNSVSTIKRTIMKFQQIRQQHEEQLKQMDQLLKQQEIENKIKEIQAKGEEDRKTQELKYYYELQMKYVEADTAVMGDPDVAVREKNASAERIENGRRDIERMKLDLERMKIDSANYNAAADRNVQREKMQNDLKIAKTNKNKYDK